MRTLLVVIALMGAVDLGLTWAFTTSSGMFEANPLVAMLVGATQSSIALIMFKLSMTATGCAALWKCRGSAAALFGAVLCAAAYIAVVGLWVAYVHTTAGMAPVGHDGGVVVAIPR